MGVSVQLMAPNLAHTAQSYVPPVSCIVISTVQLALEQRCLSVLVKRTLQIYAATEIARVVGCPGGQGGTIIARIS